MTRPLSYICRLMGLLLLAAVMPQQAAAAPAVIADTLAADSLYIYPLGPARSLLYHVRALPARRAATHINIYWNYTDSTDYRRTTFELPSSVQTDADTPVQVRWNTSCRRGDTDSIITTGKTWLHPGKGSDGAISMILRADEAGAVIELADTQVRGAIPAAFDRTHAGALAIESDRNTLLTTHTIMSGRLAVPERLEGTADSLLSAVSVSEHPLAAVWTYLDRKTNPAVASIDLDYSFATVPQPDGSILLVLISHTLAHPAMTVKGILRPTQFRDHYDLEWITADGLRLDRDVSADLQVEGSVLTLNFPLFEATVRYRCQTVKKESSDNP
ncbi:MAG: hypothetical protein K2M55_04770 [Muribaculaceae bacterium]|nr:hypothetical protein [Muribaculaceae bacterium]